MSALLRVLPSLAALSLLNAPARAFVALQSPASCSPSWLPTFGGAPGTDPEIDAMVVFDDGSGPALYAAGSFTTVGNLAVNYVAKWNGSHWSPLGSGTDHHIFSLTVFDDGSGPALYAGGWFYQAGGVTVNHVARWDGASWSALGTGVEPGIIARVSALTVFDDGSGPALYAGGDFDLAGGVAAANIAKWNGSSWSALGSGTDAEVYALTVFDDGTGPALYAGGIFSTAGGVTVNGIAKWDGSSWSALGSGVANYPLVESLAVYDDGSGPALYAGGEFTTVNGVSAHGIARWDGASWSALGTGVDPEIVHALTVYDDGSGPALYAGGYIYTAGGVTVNNIGRWDGTSWSAVGSGTTPGLVNAMAVYDDGSGPGLYAGGEFSAAGGIAVNNIARWNGSTWSALGRGFDAEVRTLATFDNGSGPALYAGGAFATTGAVAAPGFARWNGSTWSALDIGVLASWSVDVLGVYDDGHGPAMYLGGSFPNGVVRWNGAGWSPLGSGTNGAVLAMTVFDDGGGPALYVGGSFFTAGGITVNRVAKWNGSSWSALASGTGGVVRALAVYDDGSGPALYASGGFNYASGVFVDGIGKWNGSSWSAVGSGAGGGSNAMTVFDDGSGSALFMGSYAVYRWDGSTWSTLGSGMNGFVRTLTVFDDGSGPALYAAGDFTSAGGFPANSIAKWSGSSWSALGNGISGTNFDDLDGVRTLAGYDDGGGPTLFAGGEFTSAIDSGDSYLARWGCTTPIPGTAFCFGDGSAGMIACPCSNTGFPGHGCANSVPASHGASLTAFGSTNPDTVRLTASEERPSGLSIFLQGSASTPAGLVYGDGIRCVSGALKRLYNKSANAGSVSAPGAGDLSIRARSAAAGDPIPAGATRYYQVYYRDAVVAFCPNPPGNTWNVTNGIAIVWP